MPYFDANATTPLSPAAREAWLEAAEIAWQNPSSPYRSGARVHYRLEQARNRLAEIIGCEPRKIVFNSGATEGVNAVFNHYAFRDEEAPVLLSPFEHPCVKTAAKRFFNDRQIRIGDTENGRCDPKSVSAAIRSQQFSLVALMAANNETGVIQPWQETAEICRDAQIPFLCDAAQWAGKLPMGGLGKAGFVTASAHKFGGPKGCGFLVVPKQVDDFRGLAGGDQENGMRGGTENYPAIAAMIAALEACETELRDSKSIQVRTEWRNRFEEKVKHALPEIRVAGGENERLWNTVFLIFPYGTNDSWVRKLDRVGFEVSTGSACSHGNNEPSEVLTAIGFSVEESRRAVRISSSWETTETDWLALADAIEQIGQEMGSHSDGTKVIEL